MVVESVTKVPLHAVLSASTSEKARIKRRFFPKHGIHILALIAWLHSHLENECNGTGLTSLNDAIPPQRIPQLGILEESFMTHAHIIRHVRVILGT